MDSSNKTLYPTCIHGIIVKYTIFFLCLSYAFQLQTFVFKNSSTYFPDKSCFGKFLEHHDIRAIKSRFVIYHIDAPGQVSSLN